MRLLGILREGQRVRHVAVAVATKPAPSIRWKTNNSCVLFLSPTGAPSVPPRDSLRKGSKHSTNVKASHTTRSGRGITASYYSRVSITPHP